MYSASVLAASTAVCEAPAFCLLRGLHPTSASVLHAMFMGRIIISYEAAFLCHYMVFELICSSSMSFVAIACKLQSVLHDDTCTTQLVRRHLNVLVCRLRAKTQLMDILWALSIIQRSGLR